MRMLDMPLPRAQIRTTARSGGRRAAGTRAHRQVAVLEHQPRVLGVRPVLRGRPAPDERLAQDALVLRLAGAPVAALQRDLGQPAHGLLAHRHRRRARHLVERAHALRGPPCARAARARRAH